MSDDRDIVERLRNAEDPAECWGCQEWGCRSTCDCDCHALGGIVSDAANEIERLRAEVERLTDELRQVANEIALAESQEARRG